MEVRRSEPKTSAFRNSEHEADGLGKAEQLAAILLDEAIENAGLTNKEVAHLCGVSVSLVEKWRKADARGCPSFVQMLCLPAAFHIALYRVQNKRFGYGRAALARLIDAASDLALVTEA